MRTSAMLSRRIAALQSLSQLAAEGWAAQAARHGATAPPPLQGFSDIAEQKNGPQDFVYEAPFAGAVRRVKKLSLFSCGCALLAGPIILGLDAQHALHAKLSIAATLSSFGVLTTGLMHWFTGPYASKLVYHPQTQTVEVTNLNLMAKPRTQRFHLREVEEAQTIHPLTSFQARGHRYYVDPEHFPNKQLLAKLMPQATAAHVMEASTTSEQQQEAPLEQQQR